MGILDSLKGMNTSIGNFRDTIDDKTGGLLTHFGQPENQANLIAAASLLSGEGIPNSFVLRNQVRQSLLANQQLKKQREGIEALKKQYANNPRILALLESNPKAVMNAITAQAFTPVDKYQILTTSEKEAAGIKGDGVFQKNLRTGEIEAVGSPTTVFNMGGQGSNMDNTEFYKDLQKQAGEFLTSYGSQVGNINSLETALETLETDPNITGVVQGFTNLIGGDPALKLIFPETANTKTKIETVVQESLKAILGAQFTENEGKRILARAFDPAVTPQENAKRLRLITNKLKLGFEAKKAYFEAFAQGKTPPPLPTLESLGLKTDGSSAAQPISNNMKVMLRKNRPNNINATDWETMINHLSLEELEPLLGQ